MSTPNPALFMVKRYKVQSYKYLGTVFNSKLKFSDNTDSNKDNKENSKKALTISFLNCFLFHTKQTKDTQITQFKQKTTTKSTISNLGKNHPLHKSVKWEVCAVIAVIIMP